MIISLILSLLNPDPVRVQALFDRMCIYQRHTIDTCMAVSASFAANDSILYIRIDNKVLAAQVLKLSLSRAPNNEEVGMVYAVAPGIVVLVEMFYRRFYVTIKSAEFSGVLMFVIKEVDNIPRLYYK